MPFLVEVHEFSVAMDGRPKSSTKEASHLAGNCAANFETTNPLLNVVQPTLNLSHGA
jgi:hypothetical protein